jgi:hypothetical protein
MFTTKSLEPLKLANSMELIGIAQLLYSHARRRPLLKSCVGPRERTRRQQGLEVHVTSKDLIDAASPPCYLSEVLFLHPPLPATQVRALQGERFLFIADICDRLLAGDNLAAFHAPLTQYREKLLRFFLSFF